MRRRENDGEGNKRRGMQTGEGGKRRTEGERSIRRKRVMQTTEGCRSRTEVERRKQAGNKIRGMQAGEGGRRKKGDKRKRMQDQLLFFYSYKVYNIKRPVPSSAELPAATLLDVTS